MNVNYMDIPILKIGYSDPGLSFYLTNVKNSIFTKSIIISKDIINKNNISTGIEFNSVLRKLLGRVIIAKIKEVDKFYSANMFTLDTIIVVYSFRYKTLIKILLKGDNINRCIVNDLLSSIVDINNRTLSRVKRLEFDNIIGVTIKSDTYKKYYIGKHYNKIKKSKRLILL